MKGRHRYPGVGGYSPSVLILSVLCFGAVTGWAEDDVVDVSLLNQKSIMESWREVLKDYPMVQRAPKVQPGPEEDPLALQACEKAYQEMSGGQWQPALDLFNEALALDENSKVALFGRGTLHIKLGEEEKAIADLQKVSDRYPEEYAIKNNLSWLYATSVDPKVRNPERAIQLAQEALLLAPESYHVWHTVSEAHFAAGDYKKSLRAAHEALRLARAFRISTASIFEYEQQVVRCRDAAGIFTVAD